ncbi:MAG: hypothetical protein OES38_17375 [Gammaproteobacteria bacterium]|nr:hypothetical protein [Gammaproteobacteria bacterium]
MKISKTLAAALLLGLVAGCDAPQGQQSPSASAQQAIEQADASYQQSSAAGHAWSQTKVRLQAARAAFAAEDYDAALAEAERARALADASLAQAQAEQTAWQDRFPVARSPSK